MSDKLHIAILPSPGMGHLLPLIELAKKLSSLHNFSITFIIPTTGPPSKPQKAALDALPDPINYVFLPPVNFDDLPEEAPAEGQMTITMVRSLDSVRSVFRTLVESVRLVALVVDPFGTDGFDIAHEFNVPSYVFWSTNATALSLLFLLPKLDETVAGNLSDLPEPVPIPGCSFSLQGSDMPDPILNRSSEDYKCFLHHTRRHILAEGILVNSFVELEEGAIRALQEIDGTSRPQIYPIGPIVQSGSSGGVKGHECLSWLDRQAKGSVLFVSFGSGGTLANEQLTELSWGLELSGQKFLWVVRSPDDSSRRGAYFSVESDKDPFGFLPDGFLERTKDQGLLVPSWAPQIEVLSHGSTGGFLTHCGWNSILESTVHGVPLIAWPLYAEQRLNAVVLVEGLEVALRPKPNENGVIGREEIAKLVKKLFQGEEGARIRDRMGNLKEAAEKATSEDGSSTKSLSELALKLKSSQSVTV